jgi:hypothetical protein
LGLCFHSHVLVVWHGRDFVARPVTTCQLQMELAGLDHALDFEFQGRL